MQAILYVFLKKIYDIDFPFLLCYFIEIKRIVEMTWSAATAASEQDGVSAPACFLFRGNYIG
jgi:hypothetical protein